MSSTTIPRTTRRKCLVITSRQAGSSTGRHNVREAVNAEFPQIRIVPVIDQGNFIERAIANVSQSLLYGGALAVLVLLFFLRDLRSTLVISLAIPISVIATFALLYFGGFTLNLMTLGGLALGVGMMVDSSVVVLENIFRRRQERGEDPDTAAVEGTGEVASAVVAGTVELRDDDAGQSLFVNLTSRQILFKVVQDLRLGFEFQFTQLFT